MHLFLWRWLRGVAAIPTNNVKGRVRWCRCIRVQRVKYHLPMSYLFARTERRGRLRLTPLSLSLHYIGNQAFMAGERFRGGCILGWRLTTSYHDGFADSWMVV